MSDRMNIVTLAKAWWGERLYEIEDPKPITYGDIIMNADLMVSLEEHFGVRPYDAQDVAHTAIDSTWLLEVWLPAWNRNRERRGLRKHSEQNDCDNRAFAFWQDTCVLWAIHQIYGQAPAMGVVKVPGHVLNWVETERGKLCVDVQIGEVPRHSNTYKVMF